MFLCVFCLSHVVYSTLIPPVVLLLGKKREKKLPRFTFSKRERDVEERKKGLSLCRNNNNNNREKRCRRTSEGTNDTFFFLRPTAGQVFVVVGVCA